jgi:hypothetical protein
MKLVGFEKDEFCTDEAGRFEKDEFCTDETGRF